mmetsp:Transcript_110115/g.316868  ORF Transcript_110115/g.316868 Transcript_110115/m.316868 type:complete len:111 (+) Transcript_110115:485-817(+)
MLVSIWDFRGMLQQHWCTTHCSDRLCMQWKRENILQFYETRSPHQLARQHQRYTNLKTGNSALSSKMPSGHVIVDHWNLGDKCLQWALDDIFQKQKKSSTIITQSIPVVK